MAKARGTTRPGKKQQAKALERRADEYWSKGRVRLAFPLFLAAAKADSATAAAIVGQFYDGGCGVKANPRLALYWYARAYRRGNDLAANNSGVIWRDKGDLGKALLWFRRAVRLGDGDANLNIAKIYLHKKRDPAKAVRYLRATCKAKLVTEGSIEEATDLLKRLRSGSATGRLR